MRVLTLLAFASHLADVALLSAQVSQEGKDLASDDAYIVRCGPFRELVISTPEQMQEFLRKDYKGMRWYYWRSIHSKVYLTI
jgi:hypothetical protein